VDGGVTSSDSPSIALPATGTLTLTFAWYLAHRNNATTVDGLRVSVVDGAAATAVFAQDAAATNRAGTWATATVDVSRFAGRTIRLRVAATDGGSASLVEAGLDDVRITRS
jgi:aminopeptidase S